MFDYEGLLRSFVRPGTLRSIANRISTSTRAGVRMRDILRALAAVEELEYQAPNLYRAYRRSRWFWMITAAAVGIAGIGAGVGVVMSVVTVQGPASVTVSALLGGCSVVAAPVVPAMWKASRELGRRAVHAHQVLGEARQELEELIRQPFAPDPWAPLRATVTRSATDDGHNLADKATNKESGVDFPSDAETLGAMMAGALVKSMVNDGWSAVRSWFSTFVQRHRGSTAEKDSARLETAQQALVSSSKKDRVALAEKLEAEWSVRLSDVLADHPDAIPDVRKFLAEHGETTQKSTIGHNVTINAKAGRKATQTIAGIGNIGTDPRK